MSEQSKHTPGPWRWNTARTVRQLIAPNSERRGLLVSMPAKGNKAYRAVTDEDEANAQLIAAAPDLLEACRAAHECIRTGDHMGDANRVMEALAAAIARAEGV